MRLHRIMQIGIAVCLSACSHQATHDSYTVDQAYARPASHLVAQETAYQSQDSAVTAVYQLPPKPSNTEKSEAPSLLPPGSLLQSLHDEAHPAAGEMHWQRRGTVVQVWQSMGELIHGSSYQVLEKDQHLGLYFIWQPNEESSSATNAVLQLRISASQHAGHCDITVLDEKSKPLASDVADKLAKQLHLS